jgi:hypothetical protein
MSDLVKDLRNSGWYFGKPAADRIEKLEAALRTIYDCCDETGNCSVVRRIVRKALEGNMSDEEHKPLKDLDTIHVEYLNKLQKQNAAAAAAYRAEAVKWCAENLKSDRPVYKEGYRAVEEAMGHPSPEFWIERKEN